MPRSSSEYAQPDSSSVSVLGDNRRRRGFESSHVGGFPRICIVSNGLLGPVRNGGISTLYMGLAEALLESGHDVTYLYTGGTYSETEPVEYWVTWYADRGLKIVPLPDSDIPLGNPYDIRIAYETYEWLRAHDEFDVIHFHEWRGNGYYSLLAKHQGLAFEGTTLCVSTHSPSWWNRQGNHEFMDQVADLEIDYLERQSVALADILISSSRYMLEWLTEQGWRLPPVRRVLPNLLPTSALAHWVRSPAAPGDTGIEELVFFGRLEGRKGLALFCDAMDYLSSRALRPFCVTFLGKDGTIEGRPGLDYIYQRSRKWEFSWQTITTFDNVQAVDYLRQPGRLAILPSLMDNSPLAVHECLLAGIPFLASQVGGIPELVHAQDHRAVLFPLKAEKLAERIESILRGHAPIARPAFTEASNREAWLAWHRDMTHPARPAEPARTRPVAENTPLVSVCVTHFNRPQSLRRALESLRAQDYPNFEVIIVDDGSTEPEAIAYLDAIEPELASRGWQLVRQENLYPGAARNNAVRHSHGEYLLFMDDDNVAKPHEISRFIQVGLRTGADILTCFADLFREGHPDEADRLPHCRLLFLGDSLAVGAFYNCFGDTNGLVRRDAFLAIGGFTEDFGYNHEDKELYGRAILRGYRLQVIPEALYCYQVSDTGLSSSTCKYQNSMRGLRPYLEVLPDSLRQILVYAYGQFMRGSAPSPPPTEAEDVTPIQLPPPPEAEDVTPIQLPPPPEAEDVTPVQLPLRYRIADRINLIVKRSAPVHRFARSSLIWIAMGLRRTRQRFPRETSGPSRPRDPSLSGIMAELNRSRPREPRLEPTRGSGLHGGGHLRRLILLLGSSRYCRRRPRNRSTAPGSENHPASRRALMRAIVRFSSRLPFRARPNTGCASIRSRRLRNP